MHERRLKLFFIPVKTIKCAQIFMNGIAGRFINFIFEKEKINLANEKDNDRF